MTANPRTFTPTTVETAYGEALAYLAGKSSRKIAPNTYLVNNTSGEIIVTYHGNVIIRYRAYLQRTKAGRPRGASVAVDSCGWRTFTTKERLNWFLPQGTWDGERWHHRVGVYQAKHVWYLTGPAAHQHRRFEDGMTV